MKRRREEKNNGTAKLRHYIATALHRYGTTSLRHGHRRGPVRRARVISQKNLQTAPTIRPVSSIVEPR